MYSSKKSQTFATKNNKKKKTITQTTQTAPSQRCAVARHVSKRCHRPTHGKAPGGPKMGENKTHGVGETNHGKEYSKKFRCWRGQNFRKQPEN